MPLAKKCKSNKSSRARADFINAWPTLLTDTHTHAHRDRNVRTHARTGIDDTHVRPVGVAPAGRGRGRGRGSCLRDFVDFPQCKPIFVSIKAKVLN